VKLLIMLLALGLAAGIGIPAGITLADEGDIQVLATEAESQFPDGVKFSITVSSSEEIDEIRVFFKKVGQSKLSAYRTVDFQPGTLITGESMLSAGGGGDYFPPGTRIVFSFEVRDKGGAVFRTPDQDFVYIDNRFEWLTRSSDLITVYYYGEYVEERANTVLEAAEASMVLMAPVLGTAPTEPLRIVSYNNYRHMSAALPFRSQAVREQLQTQGMAFVEERVLLVHGFDPTVKGTVSHEFTHLLVAEAAGRAYPQVPAWLNEGLAEYGNIDPTDSYDAALRYGIFTRRLKPLWYQDSFSGTPDDIIIAYGQGRSVVNYMIDRYGPDKMSQLFTTLRGTLNIDLALTQVYGFDQFGLDSEWREAIGIDPLPSPEELEEQLQESESELSSPEPESAEATLATTSTPQPETTSTPQPETTSAPEPVETSTSAAVATPTPGPTPVASLGDEIGKPASSGGCNSPSLASGGAAPLGLGTLLLLAAPLGLLSFRALRRRKDY
jgi:hypothetical protein